MNIKKFDDFSCGIASISCISVSNFTDVIKKFPSSYEEKSEIRLQKSWLNVGKSIKGALDKYGATSKESND